MSEHYIDFQGFPKMARLSRKCIITEKIDGANGQIYITNDFEFFVGSRTRWITPENDNYGFARWAYENKDELMKLGPGRHFGEWWGSGIQRGYGLTKGEKRFSLFNTVRWTDDAVRPKCCYVVPILFQGIFTTVSADLALSELRDNGSKAAPGFMDPEGIVVYHIAGNVGFKKTIKNDESPKGKISNENS